MTSQERAIRTAKYIFIAVGLVMIFAMIKIPVKYTTAADPAAGYAIAAIALIDLTIGLLGRPFFVRFAGYRGRSAKPTPLGRWMIANVCSLICLYSCMLLGFVLYILRARVVPRRVAVWSCNDFPAFLASGISAHFRRCDNSCRMMEAVCRELSYFWLTSGVAHDTTTTRNR